MIYIKLKLIGHVKIKKKENMIMGEKGQIEENYLKGSEQYYE